MIKTLAVGPFSTNCYLVADDNRTEAILIDPGDNADYIIKNINESDVKINKIVLTHSHIDHIGALKEVHSATGAVVYVHTADASVLLENRPLKFLTLSYPAPPPPDIMLNGGDTINCGTIEFSVLHTPGHTPGCICLYGAGILFSGDTLFASSIGRTDLNGGNYKQIMDSLYSKIINLPPETEVYPGHGAPTTISKELADNPFLQG